MAQLRQDYSKFTQLDSEVVVVGPEGKNAFKRYWTENELPFIGLPDPRHQILKLFGQEIKVLKFGRMPAQTIIDNQGIVRYLHYGHSMSDIPENKELLRIISEVNNR
jgi:peroxiredoxin Q/BCP